MESNEKVADQPGTEQNNELNTASEVPAQESNTDAPSDTPGGRQSFKDKFNQGPEQKTSMTKEETIEFYNDNLPVMKLQDEYDELMFRFHERKVRQLELQVREVEAIGYLSQWKSGQDAANKRQMQEKEAQEKAKAEWDAMTPEQQEEWKQKARENIERLEKQAKGELGQGVLYDGTNAGEVMTFVSGEQCGEIEVPAEDKKFSFQIPTVGGGFTELSMLPGSLIERNEAGEFIVSHN